MSSLPPIDPSHGLTPSGDIEDLQDVKIAERAVSPTVAIAKTRFGLEPLKVFSIFTTQSSISRENQTAKSTANSTLMGPPAKKIKVCLSWILTNLCCDNLLTSVQEFNDAIHKNEEVKMIHRQYGGNMNFKRLLVAATEVAYKELPRLTFEERLEAIEDGQGDQFIEALTNWKSFIQSVLTIPKFQQFLKVMNMELDKIKTIYLVGAASGGKSALLMLFSSIYRFSEIGKAGAQAINSNFWLEDCVDKRICILDEIVATSVNIDSLKMLMEGSYFSHTNVKYEKSSQIAPMPVLIACNMDICRNVQGHADAIKKRCVSHYFSQACKVKLHYSKKIMAQVLKALCHHSYGPVILEEFVEPKPYVSIFERIGDGEQINLDQAQNELANEHFNNQ